MVNSDYAILGEMVNSQIFNQYLLVILCSC